MYTEPSSLRTLKIMLSNLNQIVRSWIRLQVKEAIWLFLWFLCSVTRFFIITLTAAIWIYVITFVTISHARIYCTCMYLSKPVKKIVTNWQVYSSCLNKLYKGILHTKKPITQRNIVHIQRMFTLCFIILNCFSWRFWFSL